MRFRPRSIPNMLSKHVKLYTLVVDVFCDGIADNYVYRCLFFEYLRSLTPLPIVSYTTLACVCLTSTTESLCIYIG